MMFDLLMILVGFLLMIVSMLLDNMLGVGIVGLITVGWFSFNIIARIRRII